VGRFWWVLIGVLAFLSVLMRHNLLFLMSLFLALIGGVSLLWARVCLEAVSYRRRFASTRLFYGEETEVTVEITNAKPLPLAWLRAEDEIPAALELPTAHLVSGYRPGRKRLVNLLSMRWYERVTRRYRVRGMRRGAWQWGPVEVASGDLFGFSLRRETLPESETVLVYPKIVPLTAFGLPAYRPFGEQKTLRRLVEDPLRLAGAREYAPGDSFRHIHWKATAHRQALQTKIFDPSASRPLAIFLNVNTFELMIEGQDSELQEYAITAAASIAAWAAEHKHPAGLYANSIVQPGARRIVLRPSAHPDQLLRILDALARTVGFGRWPIDAILQVEAPRLPRGTTIIVVTAVVNDRLRRVLVDLRDREYGVALVTLGDAKPGTRLPGVQHYAIGGRKEWDELEALELA
jgi:uncharacterized protein (DUF58 family)